MKLRARLAQAEKIREMVEAQRLKEEQRAEKKGWPNTWPWELCDLWLREGGTAASTRAWAEAGYEAVDVLLGDPPAAEAMDGLRTRLRNRKPKRRETS